MQLRLQRAFGLRSTEALSLKPHEADQGAMLHVFRGTKGGRGRVVPIRTEEQRSLLEKAKAMANRRTGLIGRHDHNPRYFENERCPRTLKIIEESAPARRMRISR